MPIISIHPALPPDIPAAQALFRAYGNHLAQNPAGTIGICIENFDHEVSTLPAPYLTILLATVDGDPAGCVALKALALPGEHACEMKRLYVADTHRGLGLGRRLIVAAIEHAQQAGYTTMYLDTVPDAMPHANELYASLGFEPSVRYNTNPVVNLFFYRRTL